MVRSQLLIDKAHINSCTALPIFIKSDPYPAQFLLQLTTSLKHICEVTIETNYVLVVVVNPDKSLTVQQTTTKKPDSDGASSQPPKSEPDAQTQQGGFKYRIFPEWRASFVWYDAARSGNLEDAGEVDEEELEERYSDAWNKAYGDWRDRYTAAFEKQEVHLGSHKHPFPDMEERKAWAVEGLLLACWLSLQPDVENVEYGPGFDKVDLNKDSADTALQTFLGELENFLQKGSRSKTQEELDDFLLIDLRLDFIRDYEHIAVQCI